MGPYVPFKTDPAPEKNNTRKDVCWLNISPLAVNVTVGPHARIQITPGASHVEATPAHTHTHTGVGVSQA